MIKIKKQLWFNYLVYLSFILLLIKGISYFVIQVFYPFLFSLVIIGYMLFMLKKRQHKAIKIIKFWSILVLMYGITRLVLFGLIQIDESVVPSVIFYQFNFWYHFKSVMFIVFGYFSLSNRKYYVFKN